MPLPQALSDRPEVDRLECFVTEVLRTFGGQIEFVVLFGSMAKGNWSRQSDYDVLIGLCVDDGKRFTDRIGDFQALTTANIDVLPYSRSEWQRLVDGPALIALEALADGVVLWDRGAFTAGQQRLLAWQSQGLVTRTVHGWQISPLLGATGYDPEAP